MPGKSPPFPEAKPHQAKPFATGSDYLAIQIHCRSVDRVAWVEGGEGAQPLSACLEVSSSGATPDLELTKRRRTLRACQFTWSSGT